MKTNHETTVLDVGADVAVVAADRAKKVSHNVLIMKRRQRQRLRRFKRRGSSHRDAMFRGVHQINKCNPNHRPVMEHLRSVSLVSAQDATDAATVTAVGATVTTLRAATTSSALLSPQGRHLHLPRNGSVSSGPVWARVRDSGPTRRKVKRKSVHLVARC